MRNIFFLALLILSFVFAAPAVAQRAAGMPFSPGERLDYEAKISRLKVSIPVADLSFSVEEGSDANTLRLKARSESKGSLLRLFRYSFLQEIDSVADFQQSRVLKTTKHDVQKKRVRDSVADFDYSGRRVSFTEADPNDPRRPPRRIGSEIGDEMHDIISAIYALRGVPMKAGGTFEMPVSDSGLVYKVPGRITRREQVKTVLGRVWCWRVEPIVFGPGRMIEQKGSMVLWITDDARRIPVRAALETAYGDIDVRLKSATLGRG
jgi:hypothetical protein